MSLFLIISHFYLAKGFLEKFHLVINGGTSKRVTIIDERDNGDLSRGDYDDKV